MRRPLPSLHALRAFEAVTRHLTFTAAAGELNVQQPAVSRQIADLEADLGTQLFARTKPRLTLTADGARLAAAVTHGFSHIGRATADIRARGRPGSLVLDMSIGFATCWLLARMADFQKRHADIDVQIVTRDANRTYNLDASDVVILFGDGREPGLECTPIFPEELFPICSPSFPLAPADPSAADLVRHPLLFLRDGQHEHDWETLLAPAGVAVPPVGKTAEFNSYIVYLQAILNGQGIGLGWGRLMDDLIAHGRLRRASALRRRTERGYFCAVPADRDLRPETAAFIAWITEAAA